jgi:hypothetical protein
MTSHRRAKAPRSPGTLSGVVALFAAVMAVAGIALNLPLMFVLALAAALLLTGIAIGRTRT